MNTPFSQPMPSPDRRLNAEEMDQILNAILSGKYSWACALILRFTGHEPLHYLPQRTYTRIMRDNFYVPKKAPNDQSRGNPNSLPDRRATVLLNDLEHLDLADVDAMQCQGGSSSFLLNPLEWFSFT